jgi:hypothetical protein
MIERVYGERLVCLFVLYYIAVYKRVIRRCTSTLFLLSLPETTQVSTEARARRIIGEWGLALDYKIVRFLLLLFLARVSSPFLYPASRNALRHSRLLPSFTL